MVYKEYFVGKIRPIFNTERWLWKSAFIDKVTWFHAQLDQKICDGL